MKSKKHATPPIPPGELGSVFAPGGAEAPTASTTAETLTTPAYTVPTAPEAPPFAEPQAYPGTPPTAFPPGYIPGQPFPPRKVRSRYQRKRMKTIIALSVTFLVLAGIAFGMYSLFFIEKPVEYSTEPIRRDMLQSSVMGWGTIKPVESADVGAKVKARVLESFFLPGDMVFEGDVLFTLDTATLDEEVAVIQGKIDKVNTEIEQILGDQATLQQNLTGSAPFSGKLVDVTPMKMGDTVSIGTKLGTLVDDRTLTARFYFSYAYENDIRVGQDVQVSIPATMSQLSGKVTAIHKVRRVSTEGTLLFDVDVSLTNPGALTEGMACSAILTDNAGGSILPNDGAELTYGRREDIVVRAPGKLTYFSMLDYMDYNAGTTLFRLDYVENNTQVETLREQLKTYQKELEEKMLEYDNLVAVAPMNGTIVYNNAVPGQLVDVGVALVSVAQMQTMIVEAQVDERDISNVRPGMSVNIEVWMGNGPQTLFGTVKSVAMEGKAENMMSSFPAIFEVDNSTGMLMSGMGVNYTLVVEQKFDILVSPVIGVKNTDEFGNCVFLKTETRPENAVDLPEGIVPPGFFAVPVECGIGNEMGIEIISGVNEGDEVFTQITPLDPGGGGMMGGAVFYG